MEETPKGKKYFVDCHINYQKIDKIIEMGEEKEEDIWSSQGGRGKYAPAVE